MVLTMILKLASMIMANLFVDLLCQQFRKANKAGCDGEHCAWYIDEACAITVIANASTHLLSLLFLEEEGLVDDYDAWREHGPHESIDIESPDTIRYE